MQFPRQYKIHPVFSRQVRRSVRRRRFVPVERTMPGFHLHGRCIEPRVRERIALIGMSRLIRFRVRGLDDGTSFDVSRADIISVSKLPAQLRILRAAFNFRTFMHPRH